MHRITESIGSTLVFAQVGAIAPGRTGSVGLSRHSRSRVSGPCLPRALPILALLGLCSSAVASFPQEIKGSKSAGEAQATQDIKTSWPAPVRFDAPAPRRPVTNSAPATRSKAANNPARHTPRLDPDQMLYDTGVDGAVWVHGNSYKARLDRNGATYFPFLGSQAPRNYPITLALSSVTVGNEIVALEALDVSREGERVNITRTGLVEQYVMKPNSMEQEFVFTSLPTAGDLVLRMDIASELSSAERTDGFEFSNVLGAVRYSRAVVIDAVGIRSSALTSLVAGAIEIRVAASVLAAAAFPIVIDPVVATFTVDATTSDDTNPDIAYDSTRDVYAVTWERAFSATDHDCYCQLQSASGATIAGSTVQIDFSSDSWARPRIANNANSSQFLVVANVGSVGSRIIRGRGRDAGGNTVSAQFNISDPTFTGDQFNADVGGDPTFHLPTYYFVTWENNYSGMNHDILARRVDVGFALAPVVLVDSTSVIWVDENPSISKSNGNAPIATQRWTIVWQGETLLGDRDIFGAQYWWDGEPLNHAFLIDHSSADTTRPSASSLTDAATGERTYMVVYEQLCSGQNDIVGQVMSAGIQLAGANLSVLEGTTTLSQVQAMPRVDSDGCDFAVVYSELFGSSPSDYDAYIATFIYNGSTIELVEGHQTLGDTNGPETEPHVTARHSGGAGGPRYGAVWQENLFTDDIVGGIYDTPLVTPYCTPGVAGVIGCPCSNPGSAGRGCNNSAGTFGALLTAAGVASLSGDTLVFTQGGELPNALSVVLQGDTSLSTGAIFGDGVRCINAPLKRLYTHAASGGLVAGPVGADANVHTRSAALGDTISACQHRYYQVYYRDPNLVFCAAGFNVGNALKVLWVP